jgi:hypothetical protein
MPRWLDLKALGPSCQLVVQGTQDGRVAETFVAAPGRPNRAHQLPRLAGILVQGVQNLLALVGVLGEV